MGLELARLGYCPLLATSVQVSSPLPERAQAAISQRKRWEHGHLNTLRDHVPKLLGQGIRQGRVDLMALGFDLMVPPLALLVAILILGQLVSLLAVVVGLSGLPFIIFTANILAVLLGVLIGWSAFGRQLLGATELLKIPLYVVWKLPLYLTFFSRRRQTTWERTERDPRDKKSDC